MTPQVQRDQTMVLSARLEFICRLHWSATLRSAVEEDDRTTPGVPRLHHVELDAATAGD